MLLNDFFSIQNQRKLNETTSEFDIRINPKHSIFDGHFPNQPVVPGVCMIQMVTEIVNQELTRKLHLFESTVVKFLNILDPNVNPEVTLKILWKAITENEVTIDAHLFFEQKTFFKFKGKFQ